MTSPSLEAAIAERWDAAKAHWARSLRLHLPKIDNEDPSLARLDLRSRQVFINGERIRNEGLLPSLEAILAHEVGHHARWPRTLAMTARLRLVEQQLIPVEHFSAINLFTDLLINEHLGRRGLAHELAAVYLAGGANAETAATFLFTLAVYEELWQLTPRALVSTGHEKLARIYPAYRSEAHLVAQDLFRLGPNIITQFLFFLSVLSRYWVADQEGDQHSDHCGCDDEPSNDDWASALDPHAMEDEAVDRAEKEGWLNRDQIDRLKDARRLGQRSSGLPGHEGSERVSAIMAAWYRRTAERYLIEPPPMHQLGGAIVPTVIREWEPSESVQRIDWITTLARRGPRYGAAAPFVREPARDRDGVSTTLWETRVEIFLDVSGSMADPTEGENAMTLAAMILATGTTRAGGWVRAHLYSSEVESRWEWTRSPTVLSEFLMNYVGGGTEFPFEVLAKSLDESPAQPLRVIFSDQDFDMNVTDYAPESSQLLQTAAHAPGTILVLYSPNREMCRTYERWGLRVVPVWAEDEFPVVAANLARALFPVADGPGAVR
ncbi:MAG: DUF58 domain-containing protein [Myxococcota bacterium]